VSSPDPTPSSNRLSSINIMTIFLRGTISQIESLLLLALLAVRILGDDVTIVNGLGGHEKKDTMVFNYSSGDQVDHYIRSSLKNAFAEIIENGNAKEVKEEANEALLQLAKETEHLALKKREGYYPILKKWHSTVARVAVVTLHNCNGIILKHYLGGVSTLTNETNILVQMVVEDSANYEDGGKSIVRKTVPYEFDYIILKLLKKWIDERLAKRQDCLSKAKKSKFASQQLCSFCSSSNSMQTRFKVPQAMEESYTVWSWFRRIIHPHPSTSRGTQHLYIRLSTLHYLLSHLHSLDKSLSLSHKIIPSTRNCFTNTQKSHRNSSSFYFEVAHSSIQATFQHVSKVVAYHLIFLHSNFVFYESLYVMDVANAHIRPALRILKQNLTLLTTILTDRAQELAMREVMKASFKAYLMVSSQIFCWSNHEMIEEDFDSLKRIFYSCGEGLIAESVVEREAETVEEVIALMGQCTEQLMKDFKENPTVTYEKSGIGLVGTGQKLPMPPTAGRWHISNPNTILRVLCHINDRTAVQFLKRTFQLAKRR
ncbi:hypothetical protein UlMin_010037, partial [Ulmus minor]